MRSITKNKLLSFSLSTIIFIMVISTYNALTFQYTKSLEQTKRLMALKELTAISDNIQMSLNLDLQFANFYGFLMSDNPDIPEEYIMELSKRILKEHNNIKNIGLAPDGVISFIYPADEYADLIGYNLLKDHEREPFIKEAIGNKCPTTQGPLEAMQGGLIVINRQPIFTEVNGKEEFWGLATVSVDFHELIKQNGLRTSKGGYHFALRAGQTNSRKDFSWGYKEIFQKDSLITTVKLPKQTWEIAMYPSAGWAVIDKSLRPITILFYTLAFLASITIYILLNYYSKKIAASRKDFLTGTLSTNSFLNYFKRNTRNPNKNHGLITLDVDSFKQINDTLGHPIGDQVLIKVANRIKQSLKKHDQLSRFAGDKYFVFLDNVTDESTMKEIIESICENVSKPMTIDHHTLKVSISAGGAIFPQDGTTFDELYVASDRKMYKNKG